VRFARPPAKRFRQATALAAAWAVAILVHAPVALAAGAHRPAQAPANYQDTTPLRGISTGSGTSGVHTSAGSLIGRLALGLALVVAVIYAVYWFLKRSAKAKNRLPAAGTGSGLSVVASTALGPNRAVHLLEVGDDLVLVGSAEQSVTPIRVYTGAEAQGLAEALDRNTAFRAVAEGGTLVDQIRRRTARR